MYYIDSTATPGPQDQGFYLFMAVLTLGYPYLRSNAEVEGTSLLFPAVAMPSVLGGLIVFSVVIALLRAGAGRDTA